MSGGFPGTIVRMKALLFLFPSFCLDCSLSPAEAPGHIPGFYALSGQMFKKQE